MSDIQRQVDEAVAVFRGKYPDSTEENIQGYAETMRRHFAGEKPPVEPDVLMPLFSVPPIPESRNPGFPNSAFAIPNSESEPSYRILRTYSLGAKRQHRLRAFGHLIEMPPIAESPSPAQRASEMRDIVLGQHGFNLRLSPHERQRAEGLSEDELLAMLAGAPSAREFAELEEG
jgi:hypothetical protein